jgi:hypothetical protein
MRVTKGDITIECADQHELGMALLALSGTQSDFHPLPGVHIPGGDCSLGTAELGEYLTEREEQRLRLVEPLPPVPLLKQIGYPPGQIGYPPACGPAGDPDTDVVTVDYLGGGRGGHAGTQHIPVTRCCLDVLEAVLLFPEGVYAKGVGELLGISPKSKAVGGRLQKLATMGLVEHPHHNRNLWRATPLARRSKLVAC